MFEKDNKTKNDALTHLSAYRETGVMVMHLSIYDSIGNIFIYTENEYGGTLFANFHDRGIL